MSRHYFVGSGIASLAGAAFLIRDAGVPGQDIVVFEASPGFGGALDARGSAATGYHMCGSRMFAGQDACTFDLMESIPSVSNPHISVNEERRRASAGRGATRLRLVAPRGQAAKAWATGLSERHRDGLVQLLRAPESALLGQRIVDCFDEDFFSTAFWLEWSTPFALRRWHSAAEWRRYLRRHTGHLGAHADADDIHRTRFSPYESLALPLQRWLAAQGVRFQMRALVADVGVADDPHALQVTALHLIEDGLARRHDLEDGDRVFITLGSMAADTTFGSMIEPAPLSPGHAPATDAWALWRRLALQRPGLGNPQAFSGSVNDSQWTSFTVTTDDPSFLALLARFRDNVGRQGELIRFNGSGWLLTLALYPQPFFVEQPDSVSVWWGYGLAHDRPGDLVRKPMRECTGAEILEEVLFQLQSPERERENLLAASNCIPCTMPYVTSPFMPRAAGDRPPPVPAGSRNLAFLGQYVELAEETALTIEYSVRSAQAAVYALLGVDRPLPAVRVDDDVPEAMVERLVNAAQWTPS
ncbi:oleate hydratase [Stenotrophomonas sp. HITSZ_GD]|uniref:oleate hydratase n=1 Tax=Stenotrophomonas sp. HITSZ_GD TaxID=3037248 RepID=UPI00240DA0BB|nr:oleate hydratase [Stenotrophomonas sp. HITSZ_GD]MDG2525291.1 oleate hydratase [Stenotrophomonas sp. HITSZ_GD]